MEYGSYSKKFQEVASLYIKDSCVLKYRGGEKCHLTNEDINNEINKKNRVIIEKDKHLYCYFKDEEKSRVTDIVDLLKNNNLDIKTKVELV